MSASFNTVEVEELIKLAHEQGAAGGQIALAEFILRSYAAVLDPRLASFLEKVAQDGYKSVEKTLETPAEDIALQVNEMLNKAVTTFVE